MIRIALIFGFLSLVLVGCQSDQAGDITQQASPSISKAVTPDTPPAVGGHTNPAAALPRHKVGEGDALR